MNRFANVVHLFYSVNLEQHDYDKGEFKDDCFKINAIPLRANNFVPNLGKTT